MNTILVFGKNVWKTLVAEWAFINPSSTQLDSSLFNRTHHHLFRYLRSALVRTGLLIKHSSRFTSPHHAAGAMHGRAQRHCSIWRLNSFENDRVLSHRSADKSALTRKCWRCAFAYYPEAISTVLLAPSEIVMVVD